jgi:hypothetical protein
MPPALPSAVGPALLAVALAACKVYDPLYCDVDKMCTDPARPFCDLEGEYPASDGIRHTCIPDPVPDGGGRPDAGRSDGGVQADAAAGPRRVAQLAVA